MNNTNTFHTQEELKKKRNTDQLISLYQWEMAGVDEEDSAQDVIRCSVCDDDTPKLYCNSCATGLCKSCTGEHASSDPMTKHDIVAFKFREQMPSAIKCSQHHLFACELFCKQCKIAVCSKCISSRSHRKHTLGELSKVFRGKITEIENDLENIDKYILADYNRIKTQLENTLEVIPKRYQSVRETIQKEEERRIQTVRDQAQKLQTELDEAEADHVAIYNQEIQRLSQGLEKVTQEKQRLKELRRSQDIRSIVGHHSDIESLQQMPCRKSRSFPTFTPGTFTEFGQLKLFRLTVPSYQIPRE